MVRMGSILTRIQHGVLDAPVTYVHLSGVTLVVTYLVMLLGTYTNAIGAGLSCPD